MSKTDALLSTVRRPTFPDGRELPEELLESLAPIRLRFDPALVTAAFVVAAAWHAWRQRRKEGSEFDFIRTLDPAALGVPDEPAYKRFWELLWVHDQVVGALRAAKPTQPRRPTTRSPGRTRRGAGPKRALRRPKA